MFYIKVANQCRVHPLGIICNTPITIASFVFSTTFIVLQMENMGNNYLILLDQLWVHDAKVKFNWVNDEITLNNNNKHKK